MKYVILGRGFVGSFLEKNLSNTICVKQSEVDYKDRIQLNDFINTINDQRVILINCTGYTGQKNVDDCEDNKSQAYLYNITVPEIIQQVGEKNSKVDSIIHVSSGCIYEGDGNYTEDDEPNFGANEEHSSFYSKTKHICERRLANTECSILRIRMPICDFNHPKNLITKILNYDNIVSAKNSVTDIYLLRDIISVISFYEVRGFNIFNVVNDDSITALEIVDILKENGLSNPNWKFVDWSDIKFKANRSNCTLDNSKLKRFLSPTHIPTAHEVVRSHIEKIKAKK